MQQKVCLLPDGDKADLIMKLVERISPLVAFFPAKRSWPLTESGRTCAAAVKHPEAQNFEDFQVPATLILQSPQ